MTSAQSPEAYVAEKFEAGLLANQQVSSEISLEEANLLRQFADSLKSFGEDSTPGFPPTTTPTPQGEDEVVTDETVPVMMYEQNLPIVANDGRFPTNEQVPADPSLQEKLTAARETAGKIAHDAGIVLSVTATGTFVAAVLYALSRIFGLAHFPKEKKYRR